MSHIFISYSRRDLKIVEKIVRSLSANGVEPWVDWKSIPKGEELEREIRQGIEESDVFLFFVSPESMQSKWCSRELEYAIQNGKRILPIVLQDTGQESIHPEILKRNWIYCREEQDDYGQSIEDILKTIRTDHEWLKVHARLQIKALEWERQKDNSRLLRGRELREAGQQFSNIKDSNNPQPTTLQHRYIQASQRLEKQQRRRIMFMSAGGVILVFVLALFGVYQSNIATERDRAAIAEMNLRATAEVQAATQDGLKRSQQLASIALDKLHTDPGLALLLNIEAYQQGDTYQARKALASSMNFTRCVRQYYYLDNAEVMDVNLTSDGTKLVAMNSNGDIFIWDLMDSSSSIIPSTSLNPQMDVNFDNSLIAVGSSRDGTVSIWNLNSRQKIGEIQTEFDDIYDVKFGNVSNILAVAGVPPYIELWDLDRFERIKTLQKTKDGLYHQNLVQEISFNSEDTLLAASGGFSANGLILVWDLTAEQVEAKPISPPNDDVYHPLAFNDPTWFLAYGNYRQIHIDSLNSAKSAISIETDSNVRSIIFKPSGTALISGHADGIIRWWNLHGLYEGKTPYFSEEYTGHSRDTEVAHLDILDDARLLVSGDPLGVVVLWNPDECSPEIKSDPVDLESVLPDSIPVSEEEIAYFSIHAGTNRVAVTQYGTGDVFLFDQNAGTQTGVLKGPPDENGLITFSLSGAFLASIESETQLWVWDLNSQDQEWKGIDISQLPRITALAMNADDTILALGTTEGQILLYSLSEDRFIANPMNHSTHEIARLAFSPDGRLLASMDDLRKVILWDTSVYMPVTETRMDYYEIGPYTSFMFSQDSSILEIHHLASSISKILDSHEWEVNWSVSPNEWWKILCNRVGRNLGTNEWEQYIPGEAYHPTCAQWPSGP